MKFVDIKLSFQISLTVTFGANGIYRSLDGSRSKSERLTG